MIESHSYSPECDEDTSQAEDAFGDYVESKEILAEFLERDRERLVHFFVSKGNHIETVEEAFQDVSLKFLEGYSHIGTRGFTTYLRVSVARKLIDFKRSRDRKGESAYQSIDTAPYQTEDRRATNPSMAVQKKEEEEILRGALENIQGIPREMVQMRFFEGLTDKEIGANFSLEIPVVKGRIMYGIGLIRTSLQKKFPHYFR